MTTNLCALTCLLVTFHLVTAQVTSSHNQSSQISVVYDQDDLFQTVGSQLRTLWDKYAVEDENTFIGRCFGLAKKLRTIIPMVIFILGVIVTKLGFLTIFSLKALGLLGLLLLINTAGAAAKIATALAHKKEQKTPQTVHFHIHKGHGGPYHIGHTAPEAWADDRLGQGAPSMEYHLSSSDTSDRYNLYEKLLKDPYVRSYTNVKR